MLSRKFFALLLVCFLAFTAAGCRLMSPGGDEGASAATVTIKTSIKKPAAGGVNILGNLKAGIRALITEEVVTGATVTLTLSDGRKIIMTDNGNGEYTATVTGLEGMEGFIIEARKGDLLVQNMVTDLKNTDLANIESNHLTTAFAQVAMAAAKVLATSTGIQVASLEDLIKQVTSIEIEFNELKRQVTDENNITYEKSRKYVAIGLGEANEDAELPGAGEKSLLERLIAGEGLADFADMFQENDLTTWNEQITKPIEDGDVSLPTVAPAEDKDKINIAMDIFLNAFLKVQTGTALSQTELASLSAVLDEDFVLRGMKKTHILDSVPNGKEDLDRFAGEQVLTKVTDNMYLVNIRGTAFFKDGNSRTLDSTVDGYSFNPDKADTFTARSLWVDISEFPVLVRKHTDGSWKVWGNRTKIDDVGIDLQYVIDLGNNNQKRTQLWLQVEDTTAFPVTNVIVSGGAIGETPVVLTKNAKLADSNSWNYWVTDNNGHRNAPYPATGWTYSPTQHVAGQVYKFVITFADDTTQTFYHHVPEMPAGYAPFNADQVSVTVGEDKVTLTWPQNAFPGFEDYYVNVWHMSQEGDGRVLETNITNKTTTSLDIPFTTSSYKLIPGNQYSINFQSSLNSGINQHFHKMITVPQTVDPTIQGAVAISKALNEGTQLVSQGAAGVPAPAFPAQAGSIRASMLPGDSVDVDAAMGLPTGTKYYAGYTAYTAAGSLTNIFAMPSDFDGITHQLLRLRNVDGALSYSSISPYLSGNPSNMDMMVVFEKTLGAGTVKMQLGLENYTLLTSNEQYTLPFGAVGTFTTSIVNEQFEVRITNANVDVSKNDAASAPTVSGLNLEADLYKDGQPFLIDGHAATLVNGIFNTDGLSSGYIHANGVPVALLTRDDASNQKLVLKVKDEAGNFSEVYPVEE